MTLTLGLEGRDEQEYTARQCIGGTKCFIRGKIVSAPCVGQETCEVQHGGDKQRQMQAEGCSRSSQHASELTCGYNTPCKGSFVLCFLVEPENLQTLSPPIFFLFGVIIVQDTKRSNCGRCEREEEVWLFLILKPYTLCKQ